jgi:hypothetical protein
MGEPYLIVGSEKIYSKLRWSRAKFFRRTKELEHYAGMYKHREGRIIYWAVWSNLLQRYTTERGSIEGHVL